MKNSLIILALVAFSSFGFAQSGPKITFSAKDNTIDYGTVSKGSDSGIRAFEFTNTGDAPLQITSIQSTSSCTILSKQTSTILPGKSGKIEVKYNMTPGPIRKTITVETNAVNYEEGRVALKIKGDVN
ncbi:DUF1573 domain-containing protein [Flavobacterium restrictum]|uniref:DUF1573 domain-containing protein n=1 Tax=Flavobacterium restrictum TaxID=2594428 RepID=A0A553E922_9FLAO|nr:DUF1573 domain-containing protein [Flavobacterium restrictum]TRX41411.1 DUF1573 domain-containing protein [Flavobacterium restrictum]